jgi:hypothetical protein
MKFFPSQVYLPTDIPERPVFFSGDVKNHDCDIKLGIRFPRVIVFFPFNKLLTNLKELKVDIRQTTYR